MQKFQFDQKNFIKTLRQLVQIKSVNGDCGEVTPQSPLGEGVREAIEFMLERGREWGFRVKNVDGYCAWIEAGEGSELVGILAHLDTVPVEPEGWLAPPFECRELDGMLYGRGVTDDKGPAMLALYAMKAAVDSGRLQKRVRLILGGDEEAGWRCMERYRETEEQPSCAFTPDAAYPVTYAEKGILHLRFHRTLDGSESLLLLDCGKALNVVPAYAEAVASGERFEAHGKAAHAMEPEKGDNALLKLCAALRERELQHPFLALTAIVSCEGLGIAFSDAPSGALTINPSVAHVTETAAELFCDLRLPVTVPVTQVVEAAKKAVAPFGFSVEIKLFKEPLYVEKDSPLVETLQRVYHACSGRNDEPVSTGGGTYARAFQNAVAFGALFPEEPVTYHQTNERWAIASIEPNFQIIANAIVALGE